MVEHAGGRITAVRWTGSDAKPGRWCRVLPQPCARRCAESLGSNHSNSSGPGSTRRGYEDETTRRSPRRRPATEPQSLGRGLGHREPPLVYVSLRGGENIRRLRNCLVGPDNTVLDQSIQQLIESDKVELGAHATRERRCGGPVQSGDERGNDVARPSSSPEFVPTSAALALAVRLEEPKACASVKFLIPQAADAGFGG